MGRALSVARMALLGAGLACAAALAVGRLVAAGVATPVAQLGVFAVGLAAVGAWYYRSTAAQLDPAPALGTCVHGEIPDPARPQLRARGRRRRAVERHETACPGAAHLFWHWHGLRRRVCCATCGRNVA